MKKSKLLYIFLLVLVLINPVFSQRWEKVNIPSAYSGTYWLDVYFLPSNPSYGWVCGFSGSVLRTTNGGTTWTGSRVTGADHLESVCFPSANVGYVSGPDGIFKSTNGGANWTSITPSSNTVGLWGCYFVDDNNGFVIGGGCATNENQMFWRTTDGGTNWTSYAGNLANSGLTDLIVYSMSGLGYASSSGWIWQTNDGGVTWNPWSNTGNHDWQEEITRVGNSFLVPTSTGCSGGTGGGGMRFSTDNGANWTRFNTGTRMFGSFLLNTLTGWVAGDNRNVWFTSNGGINWQLRNCGFDAGNLDDIWFISPNNGWIVGEGVYKLSEPLQKSDKYKLDFSELCIPNYQDLEINLDNLNFNPDGVSLAIINDPDNEFSIMDPGNRFTLQACGTEKVRIRFTAKTLGPKTAGLRVTFDYGTSFVVELNGMGMIKTAAPKDTLVIINPAYCGNPNFKNLNWTAQTTRESIREIVFFEGDNTIKNVSAVPYPITGGTAQTSFVVEPIDTGWIYARFSADFMPCTGDTFITVKAYGVSPIITTKSSVEIAVQCDPNGLDTIPVRNTGNSDLVISDMDLIESNTNITLIGWLGNYSTPLIIKPDSVRYIIVQYRHDESKPDNATLRIINNDMTLARGIMSPYVINISGKFGTSKLYTKETGIDFGKVCLGAEESYSFFLMNIETMALKMDKPRNDSTQFSVKFDALNDPIELNENDSVRCTIKFKPDRLGIISDTIYFPAQPCDQLVKVFITGTGVNAGLKASPDNLNLSLQTDKMQSNTINIRSTGTEDVNVTSISLTPTVSTTILNYSPALEQMIANNGNMDFEIQITSKIDTQYSAILHFIGESTCNCSVNIPIAIKSSSSNVVFDKDSINFGYIMCSETKIRDSVMIYNTGFIADSIKTLDIIPTNSPFAILNKPTLPYQIKPGDSLVIFLEYDAQNEGFFDAVIAMTTSHSGSFSKNVYMQGEFRKVSSTADISEIDFGTIEQCDMQREVKIIFVNTGTLQDSILISRYDINTDFVLAPDNYFLIAPKDSTEIIVFADPNQFPLGVSLDTIYFRSQICPNLIAVPLSIDVYHHVLSYSPDTIIYDNAWADEKMVKELKIMNNSPYLKNLTEIDLQPDDDYFKFSRNYTYPIGLKSGDSLIVPVSFFSTTSGTYTANVRITEESICIDTNNIYLLSEVPKEHYETTVSIGNYQGKPAETVTMALSIDSTMTRLRHTGVNYRISFDPYLFYPKAMLIKDGESTSLLQYDKYVFGELSGFIDSARSSNLFKSTGDILWIIGNMFVSTPDFTPVKILEFSPVTNKEVVVHKKDGSLQLIEACMPIAEFRIKMVKQPVLYVKENPVDDGELKIVVKTEDTYSIKMEIFNSGGFRVISDETNLINGYNELKINMNDYSPGVYYILISINGSIYRERIIHLN